MKFISKYLFSDYEGKQIFYLKPISESLTLAKDGSKQWDFECVCGKIITQTPYRVISGHIKSCGCMRYKGVKRKYTKQPWNPRVDPSSFIGEKNNRLKVVGYSRPEGGGPLKLKCLCDCGNTAYVLPYQFQSGAVKSCGCLRTDELRGRKKHGLSKHPLYGDWFQMVRRCHNQIASNYERYGGRGIYVCEEWRYSPEEFIKWVEENGGKQEGTTLDRIDNDGPYSPENCRWATMTTQSRNKRSNRMIKYNGKTQCLSDWAKELGFERHVIESRLNRGWSVEKTFATPVDKNRKTGKDKAAP